MSYVHVCLFVCFFFYPFCILLYVLLGLIKIAMAQVKIIRDVMGQETKMGPFFEEVSRRLIFLRPFRGRFCVVEEKYLEAKTKTVYRQTNVNQAFTLSEITENYENNC